MHTKSPQSCPTLCDPMDCKSPRLLCPWDSPDKNTGVGSHSLLQGIFLPNDQTYKSLTSPALADGSFTTRATWEAHVFAY